MSFCKTIYQTITMLLPFCRGHYLLSISSLFSPDLEKKISLLIYFCLLSLIYLPSFHINCWLLWYTLLSIFLSNTDFLTLTGRGKRRLDLRSWSYWLDWPRLLGGEFLQTDASLLKHLLDRALLLENPLYLVLMEDGEQTFNTCR